jgi:hypothetical protein
VLKKSPVYGSETIERLEPSYFARKSYSNLGIETCLDLDVAANARFSTGRVVFATIRQDWTTVQ